MPRKKKADPPLQWVTDERIDVMIRGEGAFTKEESQLIAREVRQARHLLSRSTDRVHFLAPQNTELLLKHGAYALEGPFVIDHYYETNGNLTAVGRHGGHAMHAWWRPGLSHWTYAYHE